MRNIYDIIAEQKALVDINIAKYDLDYVTNYLSESSENYYLEEGIGEGIKNIGKKIVEIIDKIIAKIKELVSKIIGFFGKNKNREAQLNNIIQGKSNSEPAVEKPEKVKANNEDKNDNSNLNIKEKLKKQGVEFSDKKKPEKNEVQEAPKEKNKKEPTIEELLDRSNEKVRIHRYAALESKTQLATKFVNTISNTIKEFFQKNLSNKQVFVDTVLDRCFRGAGDVMNHPNIPLKERVRLELGEGADDEYGEYTVSVISNITMEYIRGKDAAISFLKGIENKAMTELNSLKRQVTNENEEKKLSVAQTAAEMISIMVQVTSVGILKAYKEHDALATKIASDYAKNRNK